MRVFGIDPGSERTGYGCVETDGSRHRIVVCGAISSPALTSFPDKLHRIHSQLTLILAECRPACVAIESVFYSVNARSALKLGHARGVAMLAAVEAGVPVFEYTPAEIKRAVVGYGRADKPRTRSRSRSATCTPGRRRGPPAPSSRRAAGRPAGARTDLKADGPWSFDLGPWSVPGPWSSVRQQMIAHLRGSILEKHPNRIVIDVNGVGYDVFVPLSTFYGLGEPGAAIALRIHTHVREDAFLLYGFATQLEQVLFERLIGVSGIGPKLALAVLSGIEPQEFINAIERGDLARLTAIPGVGKKTAERIVLELKDRLPRTPSAAVAAGTAAPEAPLLRDDVVSALVNLGYHRPLAEKAAEAALKTIGSSSDAGFERLLRQALREVAK